MGRAGPGWAELRRAGQGASATTTQPATKPPNGTAVCYFPVGPVRTKRNLQMRPTDYVRGSVQRRPLCSLPGTTLGTTLGSAGGGTSTVGDHSTTPKHTENMRNSTVGEQYRCRPHLVPLDGLKKWVNKGCVISRITSFTGSALGQFSHPTTRV